MSVYLLTCVWEDPERDLNSPLPYDFTVALGVFSTAAKAKDDAEFEDAARLQWETRGTAIKSALVEIDTAKPTHLREHGPHYYRIEEFAIDE